MTALVPKLAQHLLTMNTRPLFSGKVEWGDTERLRQHFWIASRETTAGVYSGWLARRGDPLAPAMRDFVEALVNYPGGAEPAYYAWSPYPRMWFLFDPYDPQGTTTSTLVDGGGDVQGVLVERPGNRSRLVLFGTRPSVKLPQTGWNADYRIPYDKNLLAKLALNRLITSGFDLSIDSPADVMLCGLDPARHWSVNGAPVAVSGAGLARISLPAGPVAVSPQ